MLNFRQRRREMGITQEELAKEIGVKRVAVSNWERSTILPTMNHLRKLAKFFDCKVKDFIDE